MLVDERFILENVSANIIAKGLSNGYDEGCGKKSRSFDDYCFKGA